ncbi:MAG: ECF transporter S component [Bacilli bacterium]
MKNYEIFRLMVGVITVLIADVVFINKVFLKRKPITSKFIARVAIFASIATILYIVPYFQFKLPFFPAFLEIHLDEVPIFIAGFSYGPFSALMILIIRTLIKLPMTSTLGVGELADFIYGVIFVVPACFIYQKKRTFKGALLSLGVATILQTILASLITSFPILDFYMFVMGFSKEMLLAMCQVANPNVTSLGWTFFFLVAIPFNFIKDILVVALTLLLYKRLRKLINKFAKENS